MRVRPLAIAILAIGALLAGRSELRAQYTFEVTNTSGAPLSTQTVSVLLDNDAGAGGANVTGWSFGLCHDTAELTGAVEGEAMLV